MTRREFVGLATAVIADCSRIFSPDEKTSEEHISEARTESGNKPYITETAPALNGFQIRYNVGEKRVHTRIFVRTSSEGYDLCELIPGRGKSYQYVKILESVNCLEATAALYGEFRKRANVLVNGNLDLIDDRAGVLG